MYTPIDMKRSTKYGNNYWETFSPKVNRNVRFFSDLEYDNWLSIEANYKITSFCEQPLRVQVEFNDEIIETIFDMWVLYEDKTEEFLEVKYSSELNGTSKKAIRSLKQTSAQKHWCSLNNYKYSIKTEREIRSNFIYLNNLKQVVSQVKNITNTNERDLVIVTNLLLRAPMTVNMLCNLTNFSVSYIIQIISWLYYKGICNIDLLNSEINLDTEVYLIDKK
jgi:hypothetical protein